MPPPSWFRRSPGHHLARTRRLRLAAHALMAACEDGSVDGIARLLSRDAELLVDGGGAIPAPVHGVQGAIPIAATILGILSLFPDVTVRPADVNGMPALSLRSQSRVVGVIALAVQRRRISHLWLTVNPDKLEHWNR